MFFIINAVALYNTNIEKKKTQNCKICTMRMRFDDLLSPLSYMIIIAA